MVMTAETANEPRNSSHTDCDDSVLYFPNEF